MFVVLAASVICRLMKRSTAKFSCPNHQRSVQHASLHEVGQ